VRRLLSLKQEADHHLHVRAVVLLIALLLQIAGLTVQPPADVPLTPLLADDPGTVDPRRTMPDMLVMSAIQFSHPVPLLITVKSENFPLHDAGLILPWY
jgi:hypothetical protein